VRQYEPVWIQLKQTGMCELSAHRAFHPRIIKAVTKEKNIDLGFKLECTETYPPIRTILYSSRSGSIIKFKLIRKPLITLESI
jgi:hypothetical protein